MAINDENRIYDGFMSLEGGVDAGRIPSVLAMNQCHSAENLVFRGGDAVTRPGWRKLAEDFTNPNHCYDVLGFDAGSTNIPGQEADNIYRNAVMQGFIYFAPHSGEECLMAMIGGRLYKIVPGTETATVTEVNPIVDEKTPYTVADRKKKFYRNRADVPLAYMLQADKWLIIQDGTSRPIIYDGHKAMRADNDATDREKTQIPVGTIMAYGMGRIVVVVNDRDIAFGDLYGSHETPDPADSLVLFTERNFLAEGADAAIPVNFGVVTGMEFFPQLDTSTGNGQLMVFAEKGASSFFISLPREQWKTSQFQIVALRSTALRGHRSIAIANEDLWFRGTDGYRSYRQARSESTGWAHIPLSTNVNNSLRYDDVDLLKYSSSIYFDNRVIGTCFPVWNVVRPYHEGMVVVDFEILSSFGENNKPAWDGNWTLGKRKWINLPNKVIQIATGNFNGVPRAFAFGLEMVKVWNNAHTDYQLSYTNQLYELSMADKNDWDDENGDPQHIEWELVTRSFGFGQSSTPFNENELYDGDVWLKGITE